MSTAAATLRDFMGCTISEHYKLTEVLGSGSYGVVYKALDTREPADSPTRHRAVKIISKTGRTPAQLEAIRREIALHAQVDAHAHIVTLHDAFDDAEHFYLVLDFCPGGDLFYHITEDAYAHTCGEKGERRARSAFLSLVDAVQHCHAQGIAHRDLKPENVLASRDGSTVFLADFGLATTERMIDEHGSGTVLYMAPECHGKLNGYKSYDAQGADVWALGIILVNVLTGRNPWERASVLDRNFVDFLAEGAAFFRTALPELSRGACALLADVLALKPERRMSLSSLREAVEGLESFFAGGEEGEEEVDGVAAAIAKITVEEVEAAPALLSDEDEEDEDESPLVTPEGTTSGSVKPAAAEKEKEDWNVGSTAQLLMTRHLLEEQFGNGFY